MAEPSPCPYCQIGSPLWVFIQESRTYLLRCSYCDAVGSYQRVPRFNDEESVLGSSTLIAAADKLDKLISAREQL